MRFEFDRSLGFLCSFSCAKNGVFPVSAFFLEVLKNKLETFLKRPFLQQIQTFEMFAHVFLDPYGYNEKKRRRENLMRMSALSSKSFLHSAATATHAKSQRASGRKGVCPSRPGVSHVSVCTEWLCVWLPAGGSFPTLIMNRPKAVPQSTLSSMRHSKGKQLQLEVHTLTQLVELVPLQSTQQQTSFLQTTATCT